jgi:hypothetical protein
MGHFNGNDKHSRHARLDRKKVVRQSYHLTQPSSSGSRHNAKQSALADKPGISGRGGKNKKATETAGDPQPSHCQAASPESFPAGGTDADITARRE